MSGRILSGAVPIEWRTCFSLPLPFLRYFHLLERIPLLQRHPFGHFIAMRIDMRCRVRTLQTPVFDEIPAGAKVSMQSLGCWRASEGPGAVRRTATEKHFDWRLEKVRPGFPSSQEISFNIERAVMKEAMLYRRLDENRLHCFLCSQHCHIEPDETGKCGVRQNRDGKLWSLVYGKVIAQHVDPVEKKPLFHFFPGTTSYSIATAGCNFECLFCQNADISQSPAHPRRDLRAEHPC